MVLFATEGNVGRYNFAKWNIKKGVESPQRPKNPDFDLFYTPYDEDEKKSKNKKHKIKML